MLFHYLVRGNTKRCLFVHANAEMLCVLTSFHDDISGWNDPDLLEVGNNGMTTAEYRSQFAIWSLLKAPLLISTNVMNMSADTLDILSKREIIAINQDSLVRRELDLELI